MSEERGVIKVSDEVIRSIIHICSQEVEGVVCVSEEGFINGAIKMLRSTDFPKGIRIGSGEDEQQKRVDVSIQVEYGSAIPQVAAVLQNKVKHQVERITGIQIEEVNIHVDGVRSTVPDDSDRERDTATQPVSMGAAQDFDELGLDVEYQEEPEKTTS